MPPGNLIQDQLFDRHSKVLDFGLRLPEGARHVQYVAWPVLAYRVAVPERHPDLNPLQRAVLRLKQANAQLSLGEIADYLKLHESLVKLITAELIEFGWIDEYTLALTASGRDVLRGEQPKFESGANIVTGFVFQDPFTGDPHPQFVPELRYAALQEEGTWPRFLPEGVGHSSQQLFFEVARVRPPDRLSLRAISEAYAGSIASAGLDRGSMAARDVREAAGRVRLLDALPRALMLATALYFESDEYETDWVVANPFSGTDSPYSPVIHRAIQKRATESHALQNFIAAMHGKEREHETPSAKLFYQQMRAEAERKTQVYLDGIPLPKEHLLCKHMFRLQFMLTEAEALHQQNPEKLGQVMDQVRKVAETIVIALRDLYGIEERRLQLGGGKGNPTQKLLNEAAASQLGFKTVPQTLLNIDPTRLKKATQQDADHFRSLLMASVHMATTDPKHPLAMISTQEPEILMYLDRLFDIGSKSVHPMSDFAYRLPQVQQAATAALTTAHQLLKQ